MPKNVLSSSESRFQQLRRLIVPHWLWQLTWLRHLPAFYRAIPPGECPRSRCKVYGEMLWIFFKLKRVPEHYVTSRLWEKPRSEWPLYYGSPYPPVQRARFAKRAYPFEYEILFNDKVIGDRLCQTLDVRQPRIFGIVNPDEPYRDRFATFSADAAGAVLMLKPVYGRSGMGIVLLERSAADNRPIIRTRETTIPLEEFRLDFPVFVQELIRQDARIAAIWNSSVNTVRIITLLTVAGEVLVLGCGMRFGVGQSYVDNWSAGGVGAGVDIPTGRLRKYGYDQKGRRHTQHPSSGFVFEGFEVPEWPAMLDTARAVHKAIPFSKVLGLDICLDENAKPVLIEINGLPDFVFVEQLNGPLLADERIRAAFAEYGLLG